MKVSESHNGEGAEEQPVESSEKEVVSPDYSAWANLPATAADLAAAGHY